MPELPPLFSRELRIEKNRARQLLVPAQTAALDIRDGRLSVRLEDGRRVPIAASRRGLDEDALALKATREQLQAEDPLFSDGDLTWLTKASAMAPDAVLESLEDRFRFVEQTEQQRGLWTPQLGAIHAVLGHWTTESSDPATVVMPTGTGKTEAMIGLFASHRPKRVLVVVPSDALREQISNKFERLGVLQRNGVIDRYARRPVVGQLKHRFTSPDGAREFLQSCNVVVSTPQALSNPNDSRILQAIAACCTHLFVDEAHHVEAPTWREIRDAFVEKAVVQFTATPFREDDVPLGGRMVYRYPLSVAQRAGFFAEIDYTSVVNLIDPHRALATAAIQRLREDLTAGLDHVLMARAKTIPRAEALAPIYEDLAGDLNPRVLHSNLANSVATERLAEIVAGESRVVICVDMLGEGYDLPALKIAAIHDPHLSLGVTLQFVGRFARVAGDHIGKASVFVGRPELSVDHGLRRLYGEDVDWNQLISDLSDDRSSREERVTDFERGFGADPEHVSIRSLAPKMSTAVYRTSCADWNPYGALDLYPEDTLLSQPLPVNSTERVTWFVARRADEVKWADLPLVEEVSYELFVAYWDRANQLLYVNVSNTSTYPDQLAKAICGDSVKRIVGKEVFRAMSTIQRLTPTNVGVLDVRDRDRRFMMLTGADVSEGFTDVEAGTKTQTNIFGSGFEDGERVTVGVSLKGRVWSQRAAETVKHWVDWCDEVGPKLIDEQISVDDVIGRFLFPERLAEIPHLVPLALEWPIEGVLASSEHMRLRLRDAEAEMAETELAVTDFTAGGPVRFAVKAEDWEAAYSVSITEGLLTYQASDAEVEIKRGLQPWIPLSEYLTSRSSGPLILFEEEALVTQPGFLLKSDRDLPPFDPARLTVPDWGQGMNLRKESQGPQRDSASIQARMLAIVQSMDDWELVIDDDGTGEIADIVAIRETGDELRVMLTHCKYSSGDAPGARVADLYEVCGQAERSTIWRSRVPEMFQKLISRERRRVQRGKPSGFMLGDYSTLYGLQEKSPLLRRHFSIAIAQPGLSKQAVRDSQLPLLAATDAYLHEVAKARLEVFCSP